MRPLFLLVCFFSIPALAQTTAAGSTPGSFRVTEAGAAEYRIPLRVPPGIAGLEPKLALVYNSQAGNGLLGVGWSLEGLSAITRCPRTLAQDGVRGGVNYDANDRFCLDGQRLMAVSGAYGADGTQYRTERETFTKVISEGAVASLGNGPLKFKAWTKSGQVIEYGYTEDSRIQAQGKQTVRAWAVNKVSDTKGNYFTVTYSEDNANGDYRPDRIDYAGNAGFAPAGSVQFSYEPRSDIELALVAGSVIRSTARLSMIKTFGGVAAVREYRLTYDPVVPPARSRMSSVQECAGSVECLVATTLSWGAGASGSFVHWTNASVARGAVNHYEHYFADVNGDGKADWIQVARGGDLGWVGLADGDGTFQHWTNASVARGAVNNYAHYFADVNGDGRADWIQVARGGDLGWVGLSNGDGTFQHWTNASVARGAVNDYEHYFADVDGDGRADWIQVARGGDLGWVGLSNGDGTFQHWTNASVARGAVNNYAHYFADVNGDGKADWIQVARGGDLGWVGLANGDGSFQHWTSSSNVFGAALHYVHFFADLNGDGKADWVQIANGCDCGWVGLSNGDGTFRQPIFTAMAGAFHNYAHYFADVDGDGRADWIQVARGGDLGWVGLSNGDGTFQHWTNASAARGAVDNFAHYFADVNGDGKADWIQVARGGDLGWVGLAVAAAPDRLLLVADGAGRTTSVAYRPLTDDSVYAKDVGANAASYPTMDLQAPIYVVSSMSATNGAGGALSTTFSYGGLKASHDGRGALGFRWQESVELSTDLKVRIENRQDWPYVGLPSLVRRTQISGAVLSQTLNSYGSAGPAMGVYFPFVSQTVETGNDLNGAALPEVTTSRRYDGFGNPTSIEVDSGGGYLKSTTNIFDEPDTEKWLLQRLLRSTVQSTSP